MWGGGGGRGSGSCISDETRGHGHRWSEPATLASTIRVVRRQGQLSKNLASAVSGPRQGTQRCVSANGHVAEMSVASKMKHSFKRWVACVTRLQRGNAKLRPMRDSCELFTGKRLAHDGVAGSLRFSP